METGKDNHETIREWDKLIAPSALDLYPVRLLGEIFFCGILFFKKNKSSGFKVMIVKR